MDLNSLIVMGTEFVNNEPYIALGIVVFMLAFIYFRPKAALKLLAGVGAIFLVIYLLFSLDGTLNSGINNRDALLEMEE